MLSTIVRSAVRVAGRAVRTAVVAVRAAVLRLRSAWGPHRRLVASNPAYGAALAAGAAAVVRQREPVDLR